MNLSTRFLVAGMIVSAAGAVGVVTVRGADVEKGRMLFEKCAACHAVDDASKDGPTLKGVFGRKAGMLEDFRYSAAMRRSDIIWTAETLDAYLTDPQGYIRGNRMAFAGMQDKQDRDDLIAYLQQATK